MAATQRLKTMGEQANRFQGKTPRQAFFKAKPELLLEIRGNGAWQVFPPQWDLGTLENTFHIHNSLLRGLSSCLVAAILVLSLGMGDFSISRGCCIEPFCDQGFRRHRFSKCGLGSLGIHSLVEGTHKTLLISCLLATRTTF